MGALRVQTEPPSPNVERIEQELRDFSYLVGHDLGNEFRHLAEFSKLLCEDLSEEADGRPYAQIISHSAVRCQRMLRAITAYSLVQTQKVLFRRWPGRSIVERALVEVQTSHAHVAPVNIDVTGDVYGDARQLILAVKMGFENALQFGRDGVPVSIHVRGRTDAQGNWTLKIADNGEGLPKEYREKAFSMFWRLDPESPGIGAGLPMIRRIVRRHDGEARFLDHAQGACLELFIPGASAP